MSALGHKRTSLDHLVGAGEQCRRHGQFATSTLPSEATPVTFPPGLLRLATRPNLTGSPPVLKTIGTVEVTALAAAAAVIPVATSTATGMRTSSAASDGKRS